MSGKRGWEKGLVLALGLGLLLSGCGGEKTSQPKPSPEVESAPPVVSDAPVDYSKYNTYVDLADEMAAIEEVLAVYFQNVAYEETFSLVEGGDYANIKESVEFFTGMSYTLEKAQDYAKEEPAYPEADAAVLALGDSPAEVMDALEHLGSYMRFDDYVDDNMARAPELHAELWAALETYDAHYREFLAALRALDEQTDEENLEQLRESGQTILYQSQMLLRASDDIQDEVWDQLSAALEETPEGGDFTLPTIDMTALTSLVDQFNTAYNDLTAALGDQTELEKVPAFVGQHGENTVSIYQNRVDGLYVKMGELVQLLRDGADYTEALDAVNEAAGDLIDAYNNVI